MRFEIVVPAIFIIILSAFLIIMVSLKGDSLIGRFSDMANLITSLAAIGALFFLGYQISLQREDFSLDKRPYLFCNFEPLFNFSNHNSFGGGHLVFINSGQIPASDVKIKFEVGTDLDKSIKLQEWFVDNYGDFPIVQTVFPNHQNAKIFIHPQISENSKLFFVSALISYSSTMSKTIYYYKFSQLYSIIISKEKKEIMSTLVYTYTDWDRNCLITKDTQLPDLDHCDWDKHLRSKAFLVK